MSGADWLTDAADLLAQPDPGPTPWLVDGLIVDHAFVAAVGRWKTTKSYAMLEVSIAVATGRRAFGKLAVPDSGPVVFVNEEAGKTAHWRRLDALCRGRAIDPDELRGQLHIAARARLRLDDPGWQNELLDIGRDLQPRLFVFDPLARLKAATREENKQADMAPIIEFALHLRDETNAAVAVVAHTGHNGEHMRGTSDLETAWETKLLWKREGKAPIVTIETEHRDAEESAVKYRIGWDGDTRTMRFELENNPVEQAVRAYIAEHPDASANEVFKELGGKRREVLDLVKEVREQGGTHSEVPPGYHPLAGTSAGGTPDTPFRGSGTTTAVPGTDDRVPPNARRPRPRELAWFEVGGRPTLDEALCAQ